jgi:hypothetical protein
VKSRDVCGDCVGLIDEEEGGRREGTERVEGMGV